MASSASFRACVHSPFAGLGLSRGWDLGRFVLFLCGFYCPRWFCWSSCFRLLVVGGLVG